MTIETIVKSASCMYVDKTGGILFSRQKQLEEGIF